MDEIDKSFIKGYEALLNDGYCNCNEMNCLDNNSPRRILNIVKELQKENQQLKKQKDDVVEYIKNYDVFKEFSFPLMKKWEENQVKSSIDYQFKESIKKDLLRMLGEIE